MVNKNFSAPPADLNGISRPSRGKITVKPKNFRGTLARLWGLTRGQRRGLGWILLLSGFSSGASVFSPFLTGRVVTRIAAGNAIGAVLAALATLYILDWLIRLFQQLLMAALGQRVILNVRKLLFRHVRTLPLAFFDRKQHGELMSRLTNDVDNISTTISNSLSLLLTYSFTITGIFIMMLWISPLLTLVSLSGIVLIFLLTKVITGRTRKLFLAQQKALGELNGQVEESISGLSAVRLFRREAQMEAEFQTMNQALCENSTRALICSGYLMPLMNVINNLCYIALAVFSGILFITGGIRDIGLITSFLLYVRQFTRPFVEIANIYNNFQTAVAGAERVFEVMDEEPEPADPPDAIPLKSPRGEIVFDNVSFGYTPEKVILRDLSLQIPAGTRVAIVGPTGAGKTTIINLLTRFYDVSSGRILLDGHDLREYQLRSLRDAFGVVLQDTALFEMSVLENIRYGHSEASEEQVQEAARVAGAEAFIQRLPDRYHMVLEQSGNELSQGERQLLTIARAVLADAPIVILDEATSSVDTVTEQNIRRAMLKICEGRTSFIIAHRLSTIRDSDRIILIDDGVISEQGTHEELMQLNGKYARMYRMQSGESLIFPGTDEKNSGKIGVKRTGQRDRQNTPEKLR